jgi:predicted esterase
MSARRSGSGYRAEVHRTTIGLTILLATVGCHKHPFALSAADEELASAKCIGPVDAKHFVVYLHGIDSPSPSDQELGNRRVLAQIAREGSYRIALPRSTSRCPNQPGSICWGWSFNETEISAAVAAIDASAAACFPPDRHFTLVGFSNGGYLLGKMFRGCELPARLPHADGVIAVGSAIFEGPLESKPASLEACGQLVFISGSHDEYNFDPTQHYLQVLQAKGAHAEQAVFDGGHLVPLEPTRTMLGHMTSE